MAYPQKDPVPTGAPHSAVRREWEAWQLIGGLIHEFELAEAKNPGDIVEDAGQHQATCGCDSKGCRLFAAIRAWGDRFAEVERVQKIRGLYDILRRAQVAVSCLPGGSAKVLAAEIREALDKEVR